jgi:Nickel/cobalt transporter regulator
MSGESLQGVPASKANLATFAGIYLDGTMRGNCMKKIYRILAVTALSSSLIGPMSFAQDHRDDDHHDNYVRHDEWKKGYHMKQEDWHRAQPVDYRHYHLSAPPHGYEWRSVDGNYVLAAVATGVIASAIVASTVH